MDVLTNKSYKDNNNYICRYSSTPFYYHTLDNKYVMGLSSNMIKNIACTSHEVKPVDTLESLALYYYNNPTYWWVIAYFNNINDAYDNLIDYYTVLKIPTITAIRFGDER